MILSSSAQLILEAAWLRMTGRSQPVQVFTDSSLETRAMASAALVAFDHGEYVATDERDIAPSMPAVEARAMPGQLTAKERRARAAALRGLAFARQRRYEAARLAFAEAAELDSGLDLTRTPGFWNLDRGAHEAAIAAYQDACRDRDATVLRARVQSTYRPRALPAAAHL